MNPAWTIDRATHLRTDEHGGDRCEPAASARVVAPAEGGIGREAGDRHGPNRRSQVGDDGTGNGRILQAGACPEECDYPEARGAVRTQNARGNSECGRYGQSGLPLYHRLLQRHLPLNNRFVDAVVSTVLAGIQPGARVYE